MTIQFENTTTANTYVYMADVVRYSTRKKSGVITAITGTNNKETRFVWIRVFMEMMWEQTSGTLTTPAELWDQMNQDDVVQLSLPDYPSLPALEVYALPDGAPELARFERGITKRGQSLGVESKTGFKPGNATLQSYLQHLQPLDST